MSCQIMCNCSLKSIQVWLQAVKLTLEILPDCDAIDLNLGCPQVGRLTKVYIWLRGDHLGCQVIARRGHFGSFLQDEWELLERMITTVTAAVDKPITVKLRVFESMEKTVSLLYQAF